MAGHVAKALVVHLFGGFSHGIPITGLTGFVQRFSCPLVCGWGPSAPRSTGEYRDGKAGKRQDCYHQTDYQNPFHLDLLSRVDQAFRLCESHVCALVAVC